MSDDIKDNQEAWNRRQLDIQAKETIKNDISTIKQYIVRSNEREETYAKVMAKHDELLYGNSKEGGLVTSVAKLVDTVHSLAEDVWDKQNGIGIKVEQIMAKKADYDATVIAINKLTIKVGIVSGLAGGVGGFIVGLITKYFHVGGKG